MEEGFLKQEYERLRKKGWSHEEIMQTLEAIESGHEQKSWLMVWLNKLIFWGALLLLIAGNMIISVVLIPFMLIAPPYLLYPGLLVMGITFGSLYTIVLYDIGKIEDNPKIMPELFIPAIALINIYIISVLSNQLAMILNLQIGVHMPIITAIFYVAGFVTPLVYVKRALTW